MHSRCRRTIYSLLVMYGLFFIVTSCEIIIEEPGGPSELDLTWVGVKSEMISFERSDYSGHITQADSIPAHLFGIQPVLEYEAVKAGTIASGHFISSAQALDIVPTYNTENPVVDITITTLYDLDENYPAYTDMTENFTLLERRTDDNLDIQLQDLNEQPEAYRGNLIFRLDIIPVANKSYKFLVEAHLQDGTVLSHESREIFLY